MKKTDVRVTRFKKKIESSERLKILKNAKIVEIVYFIKFLAVFFLSRNPKFNNFKAHKTQYINISILALKWKHFS